MAVLTDAMDPFPGGSHPSSLTPQQLSSIPPSRAFPRRALRLWSSLLPVRMEAKSTEGFAKQ